MAEYPSYPELLALVNQDPAIRDLTALMEMRRLARILKPDIGDPPSRWTIAALLCKWANLQPVGFVRLTDEQLLPFLRIAIESKTGSPPSDEGPTIPTVLLTGPDKPVFVVGKNQGRLTAPQYHVIEALLKAGDRGLSKDELVGNSKHGDAVRILKRLAKHNTDWAAAIPLPGKPHGRYRLISATKRHKQ